MTALDTEEVVIDALEVELVTAAVCAPGDALAGTPLNGFMTRTKPEVAASPTRSITE